MNILLRYFYFQFVFRTPCTFVHYFNHNDRNVQKGGRKVRGDNTYAAFCLLSFLFGCALSTLFHFYVPFRWNLIPALATSAYAAVYLGDISVWWTDFPHWVVSGCGYYSEQKDDNNARKKEIDVDSDSEKRNELNESRLGKIPKSNTNSMHSSGLEIDGSNTKSMITNPLLSLFEYGTQNIDYESETDDDSFFSHAQCP